MRTIMRTIVRTIVRTIARTIARSGSVRVAAAVLGCGAALVAGVAPLAAATGSPASTVGPPLTRAASADGAEPGYRPPLVGAPRVTRWFDPPPRRWLPGHRGVDLAGEPGAVVRAAGAGVVRFAGRVADRPLVSIDHSDGLRTTYEPVRPLVDAGDRVSAGEPIGVLVTAHSGCPVAACLHWGLRRGEHYLDPLSLLGLGPVRLLPD